MRTSPTVNFRGVSNLLEIERIICLCGNGIFEALWFLIDFERSLNDMSPCSNFTPTDFKSSASAFPLFCIFKATIAKLKKQYGPVRNFRQGYGILFNPKAAMPIFLI